MDIFLWKSDACTVNAGGEIVILAVEEAPDAFETSALEFHYADIVKAEVSVHSSLPGAASLCGQIEAVSVLAERDNVRGVRRTCSILLSS